MSKENKNKDELSPKKAAYDFGTIEKIEIKPNEMELAVFALADAMPNSDGIDPTRYPAIT